MNVGNLPPATPKIPASPAVGPGAPGALAPMASRIAFRSLLREVPVTTSAKEVPKATTPTSHAARGVPQAHASSKGTAPLDAEHAAQERSRLEDEAEDPLHPYHRQRAALAPPEALSTPQAGHGGPIPVVTTALDPGVRAAEVTASRAASSLEELLPALVRRVAWSGDGRRGTVRMELGAGSLSGGTLLVHADDGRVRVQLDLPPGADASSWKERIAARLSARGIEADAIEVT